MEFVKPDHQLSDVLEVDRINRWNIYNRLRQLGISCQCQIGQPLVVQVTTADVAVQLWSVVQQFTAPREANLEHLQRCWQQQPSQRQKSAEP
ncbi:MAG TPA: Asr1405/Asl0597 family protein [Trichocoleus sp.]